MFFAISALGIPSETAEYQVIKETPFTTVSRWNLKEKLGAFHYLKLQDPSFALSDHRGLRILNSFPLFKDLRFVVLPEKSLIPVPALPGRVLVSTTSEVQGRSLFSIFEEGPNPELLGKYLNTLKALEAYAKEVWEVDPTEIEWHDAKAYLFLGSVGTRSEDRLINQPKVLEIAVPQKIAEKILGEPVTERIMGKEIGTSVNIILKTDNIILSEQGRFQIFDPR